MNLPSFPTDNLYKFLAISGLFICIFSIVFPKTRTGEINQKTIELKTRTKVLGIEVDEIVNDSVQLHEDLDRLKNDIGRLKKTKNTATLDKKLSEMEEKRIEIRHNDIRSIIKRIELEGQIDQIKALTEDLMSYNKYFKVGISLGIVLSYIGFFCWFFLVQYPSDILLRRQVKQLGPFKATDMLHKPPYIEKKEK